MFQLLLVASGGAIGAICRFLIGNLFQLFFSSSIYGTLIVNIIGSFLIGYLISLGYYKNLSEEIIKYFLIIGFLGSFTTFSAFSYETLDLIVSRKIAMSFFYISISVFICIISAYLGMSFNKFW